MVNKIVLFNLYLKAAKKNPHTFEERPQIYTNDKQSVELQFNALDTSSVELGGASATILLFMGNGSFFQKTDVVRQGNTFSYVMKDNETKHSGIAKVQLVVEMDGVEIASPLYEIRVIGGLETKPIQEVEIQDWTTLTAEAKAFVDQIEGFTLDQFVENKMGEELANLEVNYATRLTGLETADQNLTAQLAQKAEDIALRPTKGEVSEIIGNIADATPLFADSISQMQDTTRLYVNLSDGYLYVYTTDWTNAGVKYQSEGITNNGVKPNNVAFISGYNLFGGVYGNTATVGGKIVKEDPIQGAIVEIKPGADYQINVKGNHNRFSASLANTNTVGTVVDYLESKGAGSYRDTTLNFRNDNNYKYLILFINYGTSFIDVNLEVIEGEALKIGNTKLATKNDLLLVTDIKGTKKTVSFDNGFVEYVRHTDGNNIILREDTFTMENNVITETRRLNTGETITYKHNLTNFETEVN